MYPKNNICLFNIRQFRQCSTHPDQKSSELIQHRGNAALYLVSYFQKYLIKHVPGYREKHHNLPGRFSRTALQWQEGSLHVPNHVAHQCVMSHSRICILVSAHWCCFQSGHRWKNVHSQTGTPLPNSSSAIVTPLSSSGSLIGWMC